MRGLTATADEHVLTGTGHLPRVNLLPPEIAVRTHLRRVQTGLAGVVALAVLLVGLVYVQAQSGVSDANDELTAAGTQQVALQRDLAKYRDVTATYKRVADAQAMLVTAMGQEVRYSRLLNDLSLSIPENVWVIQVSYSQSAPAAATSTATAAATAAVGLGTVTFSGVALSHDDVALWLESLSSQQTLGNVLLQSSTEALLAGKKVVNWSSTAALSPAALSGRYTKTG